MLNQWWEMIKDLFDNPLIVGLVIVFVILFLFNIGLQI